MTARPSALEVLLIPALDAYSASLEAHRTAITDYREPARCACGFEGKVTRSDPRGARSLGLHRSAAEKRADRAYDVATEPVIRRASRLSSAEATAIVDEHVAQLEAADADPVAEHRAEAATFAKVSEAHAPGACTGADLEDLARPVSRYESRIALEGAGLANPRARSYAEFLDAGRAAAQQAGTPVRFDPYA